MSYEEVTIGRCRLICGDALDIVPSLTDIGLIVTSPPFNAGREYELDSWTTLEAFFHFTRQWVQRCAATLRPGGWCFVEVQDMHLSPEHPHAAPGQKEQTCMPTHAVITQALIDAGMLFKNTIMWDRGRWGGNASRLICAPGSPAILDMHSYGVFARRPGGFRGAYVHPELSQRDKALWLRSVWSHIRPEAYPGHPAVMPVSMAHGVIQGWSLPPDVILDPFMGSGTTGVASLKAGRSFIGIEQQPRYFALACERLRHTAMQGELFPPVSPPAPRQLRLA